MSYSDIKKYLSEIYGLSISPAQMSEITDLIIPELEQWQSRALDEVYALVWFDAIHLNYVRMGPLKPRLCIMYSLSTWKVSVSF